jgi:hypothetical protein
MDGVDLNANNLIFWAFAKTGVYPVLSWRFYQFSAQTLAAPRRCGEMPSKTGDRKSVSPASPQRRGERWVSAEKRTKHFEKFTHKQQGYTGTDKSA